MLLLVLACFLTVSQARNLRHDDFVDRLLEEEPIACHLEQAPLECTSNPKPKCSPFRSIDYCAVDESLQTYIQRRNTHVLGNPNNMGDQWFHHIENKLAAYKLSASLGLNPPKIYSCSNDLAAVTTFVPPEGIEGFVIRAAGLHSNKGIFVLPNGFGGIELIQDMMMNAEDIESAMSSLQIDMYVIEEYVRSDTSLPLEVKLHMFNGKVGSINLVANRGSSCECWAEMDTNQNRLDQYGCFVAGDTSLTRGGRADEDQCTEIDFEAGAREAFGMKGMDICSTVPTIDDCIMKDAIEVAKKASETIGVYVRVDLFVGNNGQIYLQEFSTNHMNGSRHCSAVITENGCIDPCFQGVMWKNAGGESSLFGGPQTAIPDALSNWLEIQDVNEQCRDIESTAIASSSASSCSTVEKRPENPAVSTIAGRSAQLGDRIQCNAERDLIWVRGTCQPKVIWHGFTELGQTHVVKAHGETRHAPKIIADREAELLFFPTEEVQPTSAPSSAPSHTIDHVFGLEQIGNFSVDLTSAISTWPNNYPKDKTLLIDGGEQAYYLPASIPDVNFNFDLETNRAVQGVYLKIWYYSRIDSVQVGYRGDDGADVEDGDDSTAVSDSEWTWVDGGSHTNDGNKEVLVTLDLVAARYVQIRVRGGWRGSSKTDSWGIRKIKISGSLDGTAVDKVEDNDEDSNPIRSVGFFPNETSDVLIEAYDVSGAVLGSIDARPTSLQRGILDQSQTEDTVTPYSGTKEMWSSTLPWQWVKDGTELTISVKHTNDTLIVHTLTLHNIAIWSEHSLIRQKFVLFGNQSQFDDLDTSTFEPHRLATGMFGIMPIASLNWIDSTDLHWPYLVVSTKNGARKVFSERERRAVISAAGDDPSNEARWEVTKNMIAFRHSYANTGRGFTLTTLSASGNHGSPYSTQTSIAMGWALVNDGLDCSFCQYKKLGYWGAWAAAASLGWCGMKAGDECGNIISHEIGHSTTLGHFTDGAATRWGISDEYPQDGTHLESHPWGYDTTSRQFRTWYDVTTNSSKKDPMNGGGSTTSGSCYPHYTGYHGQKSQSWGSKSTQILSADTSGVPSDGLYQYDPDTKALKLTNPEARFMPTVETGVPVITFIGTLGSDNTTCQTYPPSMMDYGHTFAFPNPFDNALASAFEAAAYAVEVHFADGSSELGLIASPDLRGSTELRLYSFNVALSRNPLSVDLYQYETDSYPNISPSSTKTLLNSRAVPSNPLSNISQRTQVGRGWLGHSGDVKISQFCFGAGDCAKMKQDIKWCGSDGIDLSFVATAEVEEYDATASSLVFDAKHDDGSAHRIAVAASKYVGDSNWVPLIGGKLAPENLVPDDSYGVAFWLPYDLNTNLPQGRYTALSLVAKGYKASSQFVDLRINLNLLLPEITETVDFSKVTFTSDPISVNASAVYFVADDPAVGPSEPKWWGTSRETLFVPMVAANCSNVEVVASIKAQNKCGNSYYQMNAGRGANDCVEHSLSLQLDGIDMNPWMKEYDGCKFETRPVSPVTIMAYAWHGPIADNLLRTMRLAMVVDLGNTA